MVQTSGTLVNGLDVVNVKGFLDESNNEGKKLYMKNSNYKEIATVMEHPEFRQFFNKHLSTPDKMKDILLFLKLYEEIEKNCPIDLNGYQKIFLMDKAMKTPKLRRGICEDYVNWYNKNSTITSIEECTQQKQLL